MSYNVVSSLPSILESPFEGKKFSQATYIGPAVAQQTLAEEKKGGGHPWPFPSNLKRINVLVSHFY